MKTSSWTVSPAPFLLTRPTVSRMSVIAIATLIPQLLMLAVSHDTSALLNIAAALAGCLLAELFAAIPDGKNPVADGTVLLAGLLAGMLFPTTLNPFIAFISTFSGFLVARVLFGGAGSYWIHPVAVAVSIAYISQAAFFPQALVTADGMRVAGDAFGALKLDHFAQLDSDQGLASFLNGSILGVFGIRLPEGYVTLFWNSPSVIPAFRYNLLTIASSIILIALDIADWIIPLAFLSAYGVCVWFLSLVPFDGGFSGGNILFALLTSGTLFIAFYILPDFSTSPRTRTGKCVSGVIAGLAAFCLCGPGGSSVGGVFTVIFVNAVNPVIEYLENRAIASAEDIA